MKETITIKNFGGLKNVTIPLNSINIFIGKQASGKSVTAKLIYFFKKAFEDIFDGINEGKEKKDIYEDIKTRFKKYFPVESWSSKGKFVISYKPAEPDNSTDADRMDFVESVVKRKGKSDIDIDFSDIYLHISAMRKIVLEDLEDEKLKEALENRQLNLKSADLIKAYYSAQFGRIFNPSGFQNFIPAGRSFFSNIKNSIFSILAEGSSIDPFLLEFGQFYERFKSYKFDEVAIKNIDYIDTSISDILDAEYLSDKSGEYLVHKDGRKINLLFCSSGQQEVLPLAIILRNVTNMVLTLGTHKNTFYIEEPEAHLFPSTQKKIVEMIAVSHNAIKKDSQIIITTHSPYILTSFNNLLQAGHLLENGASKRKLFKIVPEFQVLKPGELNAYAFEDGGVTSLIDEETGLISADMLDRVSEEIAVQFEELLDL